MVFFFKATEVIRNFGLSRGLGDGYKKQKDSYVLYDAMCARQSTTYGTWKSESEKRADIRTDQLDVDQNARAALQVLEKVLAKIVSLVGWEWERPNFTSS